MKIIITCKVNHNFMKTNNFGVTFFLFTFKTNKWMVNY